MSILAQGRIIVYIQKRRPKNTFIIQIVRIKDTMTELAISKHIIRTIEDLNMIMYVYYLGPKNFHVSDERS